VVGLAFAQRPLEGDELSGGVGEARACGDDPLAAGENLSRPAARAAAWAHSVPESRRGAPLAGVAAGGGGAGGQCGEPHGADLERAVGPLSSAGAGPLCGAQMRYALRSRTGEWLGGLAFSAAVWRVAARDRWIGWSDEARREHLPRVIANSRFLLLPWLHVPHLASHVLGQALRRVGRDWQERYGYAPYLVETFVDAAQAGTCYRAANWIEVGPTAGRGRQDGARAAPVGEAGLGVCFAIGIGGAVARPPLPHHRTYGARIRRFRDLSPQGPEVRYAFRQGGFAAPSFLSGFTRSVPG